MWPSVNKTDLIFPTNYLYYLVYIDGFSSPPTQERLIFPLTISNFLGLIGPKIGLSETVIWSNTVLYLRMRQPDNLWSLLYSQPTGLPVLGAGENVNLNQTFNCSVLFT